MTDWPTDTGRFALGDLTLQSGAVLPQAVLSWKTHGTLAPARDNVVLYPTSYSARHPDLEWLIGPDGVLDPHRWFIVIPDMFGNGLSSSPSNTPDWPGAGDVVGQRACPAAPAGGTMGYRAPARRVWLVDGRAAGLPLGGAVPRSRRACRCELRQRPAPPPITGCS